MIHFIVLNFGYVESAVAGNLFFFCREGHGTRFGALRHLAHSLYDKYRSSFSWNYKLNNCCTATKLDCDDAQFCRRCGRNLSKELGIDWVRFADWIPQLLTTDCDSFASCEVELEGWELWVSMTDIFDCGRKSILKVPELGTELIIRALDPKLLHQFDRSPWSKFIEQNVRRWFYDQPIAAHVEKNQMYRV